MRDPYFQVVFKKLLINPTKKIDSMKITLEATDVSQQSGKSDPPTIYITDVMLQGGTVATSWIGHVSEIRWAFDTA